MEMTDENLKEIARIIEENFQDHGFILTLFSKGVATTTTNVLDEGKVIGVLETVLSNRKARPNMKMQ